MTIDLKYDKHKRILVVTGIGEITAQEIASTFDKIGGSPEYPPNADRIWDLRKADLTSLDEKSLLKIIQLAKQYPEFANYSMALIASTDLSYGVSRMYELLSEGELPRNIMVFREYSEGEKWILQERTP